MSSQMPARRSNGDNKKVEDVPNVTTRNGARKAKIQTRAMVSKAKPSAVVVAAKKKAQLKKKSHMDTILRDHYQTAMDSKKIVKGATGITTDPKMIQHRCLWDANYPECPERLTSVLERCRELGLIDRCESIPSRLATKEEVNQLHSPLIYEILENTQGLNSIELLEEVSSKFDAVYIHPTSHELALSSVGSTIDLVDAVVSKELQNGVAFIRPPGHHAMKAEPCGYCFYNNVALAAKHALDDLDVERILIVDWDVHHGQATQQMFYDDPRVVYFSIHRYEHGAFWPNLRQSNFNYIGTGEGTGFNFNVPLNKTKMQDADYLAIWHQLLLPIAFEFQPELVIVSAGYDAALGCPEGEMEITPTCYAHLTSMLMSVCSSICVVLEGGYCLQSLAEGAAMTLRTLLGDPVPVIHKYNEPCESIKDTILNCIYVHKPYWKSLHFQPTYSIDDSIKNVCDVLKEKHKVEVHWKGDEERPDSFLTRDCYPKQSEDFLSQVRRKLDRLRMVTDLSVPQHQVCYIYDKAMLKHKNVHEVNHVERPERIMRIHERHRDFGLLERVHILEPRSVTEEEIKLVHTTQHIKLLRELATSKDLAKRQEAYNSVYLHQESYESARVAAGCVLQMVDTVISGVGGSGVCVVRPPGHHAEEDLPCGFCLLNNIAIAAKYAITCHSVKRVLIVDWDVHHGNGTQHIFEDDPRVLYISLHRYDNGTFFPNSDDANYTKVGKGKGVGYNVNIPWNKKNMSDPEYLAAFTNIVMPIAYEFDPELVLVSAGFDACVGDPLGGCKVSPECYGRFTHLLKGLAHGRVILCLEGGYNITSISYAMTMCTKALLGDPLLHHYDPKWSYNPTAIESINDVIRVHKKYWKNLGFQLALPKESVLEAPKPSRGLIVVEETLSEVKYDDSKNSSFNDTLKSESLNMSILFNLRKSNGLSDESLDFNLSTLRISTGDEEGLSKLSIKCEGGNCGSDDENERKAKRKSPRALSENDERRVTRTSARLRSTSENQDDTGNQADVSSSEPSVKRITRNKNTSPVAGTSGKKSPYHLAKCDKDIPSSSSSVSTSPKRVTRHSQKNKERLVDYLADNMQAIVDGEMFAVIPQPWCPHLDCLTVIPNDVKFEQGTKCFRCDHNQENWICLCCYVVACARSIAGHMQEHFAETQHPLVLSLTDLSVWCNICDAYVDNALLYDAKNRAHQAKFGEDMPWCYGTDHNIISMQ